MAPLIVIAAGTVLALASYVVAAVRPGRDASRAVANANALLSLEHRVGLDIERSLQASALGQGHVGAVLNIVYATMYWPFVVGTLIWTAWRHRAAFRLMRNAMLISGAVGLAVMALFPVAPPRVLGTYQDQLQRYAALNALAHPSGLFNPNAAMPSFHVGWMIVAAFALRSSGVRRIRWVPPVVMALAVITTGNHYVVDVLAGAGLACAAWTLAAPMQNALDVWNFRRRLGEGASVGETEEMPSSRRSNSMADRSSG